MPPEHGMRTATTDAVVNRRPRRLFGRLSERKNPLNLQFERQVARLESRQQQQRCIILTVIPLNLCYDFNSLSLTENGNNHPSSQPTSPDESHDTSYSAPTAPSILFLSYAPDGSHRWPDNSSRLLEDKSTTSSSMSNSDFLVNSFPKPSGNARQTSRRKSKKKSKKHKQRCRKQTDGPEAKCRESNSAAPAVDVGDCEDLTHSPKHVGDIHFEETFSRSSSVKEASEEAPESDNDNEYHGCSGGSASSASYCDEMELSGSAISCPELCGRSGSGQETCYAGSSVNCNHDTKTLLVLRNEREPDPCETTEFCSSSSGFDENWLEKSDFDSGICSQDGVDACRGVQAVHFCSDPSSDSEFCLVVSRKRARKEKKMSLWKSYGERTSKVTHDRNEKYAGGRASVPMTKEVNTNRWPHRQNHVGKIRPQHGISLKHSTNNVMQRPSNGCMETKNGVPAEDSKSGARLSYFVGPREKTHGKSTSGFDKVQQLYLNRKLSDALHGRESVHCETRSVSSSEPATPQSLRGKCTSESGESTDITEGALPMQKRRLQDSVRINDASETISGQSSPGTNSMTTELMVGCGIVPSTEGNHGCQVFYNSRTHLVEMLRVVNNAYKVQVAADVHLVAGHPITDLDTFIYSATPVIGYAPCMRSNNCSWDQVVSSSVCQCDISNVSLRSIWEWYEEPGCYGLEVKAFNDLSSKTSCSSDSEFFAYFVPYLSAIQLFGWSRNNMDHSFGVQESNTASSHPVHLKVHKPFEESNMCLSESSSVVEDRGELMFEYFETDQPSFRSPLFEKVKELVSCANVSDHRIVGDPEKLQNTKLCELHPASWFCVAWYPVYRMPRGNFRASFLTYHSLGKLVPQKCSLDRTGGDMRVVSPVVGLQSYNDKGEQWFQLRCPGDLKQSPRDEASRAKVHQERLRTLKTGALAMARAVVPKGSGESVNHHPDFEFFLSRSG